MKVSLKEYLNNPCGTLSIPYWKAKITPIPNSIVILHQNEFHHQYEVYQRYFRLIHSLNQLEPVVENIEVLSITEELLDLLNTCFKKENIALSYEELYSMQNHTTFYENLWVGIRVNGKLTACGIAEYDNECREGCIEWICVLPQDQRKGYGTKIISHLLHRLKGHGANFVTVSGRMDNASDPERFYRACGFVGSDVWYICKKES